MRVTRQVLAYMLESLKEQRLEVCKVPYAIDDTAYGYKRVLISSNAYWYQQFCEMYVRVRRRYPKLRTFIKRRETIRALERIIQRRDRTTVYAIRLIDFVKRADDIL